MLIIKLNMRAHIWNSIGKCLLFLGETAFIDKPTSNNSKTFFFQFRPGMDMVGVVFGWKEW